jgi:anti-sigma B factor antagonist
MSEKVIQLKENLKLVIEENDGFLVVKVMGNIDTYNSLYFQKELLKIIDEGNLKLLCNCSDLNYVSSTGIGAFTLLLKTLKQKKGNIVLTHLQSKVYEVFNLLGFTRIFNIASNNEEGRILLCSDPEMEDKSCFPRTFTCPNCSRSLEAIKSGKFRCPYCKTILNVDTFGKILME